MVGPEQPVFVDGRVGSLSEGGAAERCAGVPFCGLQGIVQGGYKSDALALSTGSRMAQALRTDPKKRAPRLWITNGASSCASINAKTD